MDLHARKLVTAVAVAATLLMAAPAAAFAAFGAIAVNPATGHWGKAWGWPTKQKAERKALHLCRVSGGGSGCQGVIWVGGTTCGAVNENSARTKFYFAFAHSESRAEAKVLARHPSSHFITAVCANHS